MKQTSSALACLLLAVTLAAPQVRAAEDAIDTRIAAVSGSDLDLYFAQAELTVVESASHAPKPITQAAENITVITAQEIERWNAHTLQEVLVRVPGMLVQFSGQEVANGAILTIQGSDYEHVQVFIDGVRWNDISSGFNETDQIPVGIIQQVEIIKGPASSTWGSAFGGVVNIITKSAGTSVQPSGTLTASYGERGTTGTAAEVKGLAGPLGYYLYGQLLNSDGLKNDRWLDSDAQYAKLSIPLPAQTGLTLSLLRTNPEYQYIRSVKEDVGARWDETIRYATASVSRPLGQAFHLLLAGSLLSKRSDDYSYYLSSEDETWSDYRQDSKNSSGSLRVYGDLGRHSLSLGAETSRSTYDENYEAVGLQLLNYPPPEESWSVYANDTIHLGRATLIPGLRYDSMSIADPQLSPSLGLTVRLNDDNLLRAEVARGFRRPQPILKNLNQSFGYPGNPQLESEVVNSTQLGIESTAIPFLLLKATIFRHDARDVWRADDSGIWVNGGGAIRDGIELAMETERWHGLSLQANHTLVRIKLESDPDPGDTSFTNLIFDYQGDWGCSGRLAGNHVWYNDVDATSSRRAAAMVWDATATKAFPLDSRYRLDLFASAHNLFNGSQTVSQNYSPNADRWLEAGLRLHF